MVEFLDIRNKIVTFALVCSYVSMRKKAKKGTMIIALYLKRQWFREQESQIIAKILMRKGFDNLRIN